MILTVTLNPAIDKVYLVEDYQLGEVHRPSRTIVSPGGKGLNVAKVAYALDQKVGATGFLGGASGEFLETKVREIGIESEFLKIDGETRTCVNVSDPKNGKSTEVLEAGPWIQEEVAEQFLKHFENLIPKYNVIALSGSLPQGLNQDYYKKLIKICKKYQKKVLLDTSGQAFMEGLKGIPYLVKPNIDEIKQCYPKTVRTVLEAKEAVLYFKEKNIGVPILSMGKEGCVAALENNVCHFSLAPVEVINTVGSGDSFIAGCAVGFDRGYSLEDSIKLAVACGTANTQFAETGHVTKELVEYYLKQIQVTIL